MSRRMPDPSTNPRPTKGVSAPKRSDRSTTSQEGAPPMPPADSRGLAPGAPASCSTPATNGTPATLSPSRDRSNALCAECREERGTRHDQPSRSARDGTPGGPAIQTAAAAVWARSRHESSRRTV